MKLKYELDIQKFSNKGLDDSYRYDKLLTQMNAQVLEQFIPKILYQIQYLFRNGYTDKNKLDFRDTGDDYYFIEDRITKKDISRDGSSTMINKKFIAYLNHGQQSKFKFDITGYTINFKDGRKTHQYYIDISDLEYDTPSIIILDYELCKNEEGIEQTIKWNEAPSPQGDSPSLIRRLLRLVDGLEFYLTKEMSVFFLVSNMLWLSKESKRERELKNILD